MKKTQLRYVLCVMCLLAAMVWLPRQQVARQSSNTVAVVSAASYATVLASESIAALFGADLTSGVAVAATTPLPTTLGGVTVRINDQLAPLFFVSPGQINLLIPAGLAAGSANVVVTSSDGKVSRGVVQIARVAPALFTSNGSGAGVPAAQALRAKADGSISYESVAQYDAAQQRWLPLPLDLGPASDTLFLVLFGTGLRGRENLADVAVRIGGVNARVEYAGAQGLVGLDQINVLLPRELIGRGRINLALTVNGFGAANLVELETAGAANIAPPQVASYSEATTIAGNLLTIRGAGFSANTAENLVRIGGVEARIETASATQLTVRVPFGAQSGAVSVRTPQGETQGAQPLQLRTSVSGLIEDTRRQPLAGVTIRALGSNVETITGTEGFFILRDLPAAVAQDLEIDGGTVAGSLPYPKLRAKLRVIANRDNQLGQTVTLQQIGGQDVPVSASAGTCSPAFRRNDVVSQALPLKSGTTCAPTQLPAQTVRVGNVTFEVPAGATVSFPSGTTRNTLNLTLVENSRPPFGFPAGLFSATVPQLTPFSAGLLPGGKLTFPNDERYPAGTQVKLYRLDQIANSASLGQFVEAGTATVTADGQRIETAPNAITEITQYFAAVPRQTTTVAGRVVDSNGVTPIRQALVRCRGQETFTDGNGGFVINGVVVNAGDTLSVEASFARANGRVDRTQRSGFTAVVNGLTTVTPDLILPAENSNRPPVLLAPVALRINEGESREVSFVAFDPDPGQTIQLAISGASFATLIERGNGVYSLRLQPRANDAGRYTLALSAVDNLGQSNALNIALSVNRPPRANAQSVVTDEDLPRAFTLTGSDPDGDALSFEIVTNPLNGRLSGTLPNLTYTPNPRYTGSDSFTFKVNDGLADSAPATVTIAVNPINHAPALTVPPAQTANEGQDIGFTVTASDIDAGQTLTFTATGLPGGANFTPTSSTTARFVWTPTFTQAGSYTVNFRVTDNGVPALSDNKTVALTVRDVNRAPVLTVPGAQTLAAGQLLNFTVSARDADSDQTLQFSVMDLPTSAAFDPMRKEFSWRPVFLQAGKYAVTFQVTDSGSPALSDSQTMEISVTGKWTPTGPLEGGEVGGIVAIGTTLFAGGEGGVFRSTNSGQSWSAANGDSVDLGNTNVTELFVNGNTLFAGTGLGVFRSTNQGQTWRKDVGLPRGDVFAFATLANTLFAGIFGNGVFRSIDDGQTWTPASLGLPQNSALFALGVNGTSLFAGTCFICGTATGGGFYVSHDQGQSWNPINGLPITTGYDFATLGSNLFVATGQGVFASTNNGQSWTLALSGLAESMVVIGSTIYVSGYGRVSISTNQGQSWGTLGSGLPDNQLIEIAAIGSTLFVGSRGDGMFRLESQSQNWVRVNAGLTLQRVYGSAVSGTNLFAATDGGVFVTANNGESWRLSNTGLRDVRLRAITASGSALFIGGASGVYRSTDQGRNWVETNNGLLANRRDVRSLTAIGATLFVGICSCSGGGLFVSNNAGQSWTSSGLNTFEVSGVVAKGTTLFAGTRGNGVFRSTNNGQSWMPVSAGLSDLNINALSSDGFILMAGTYSGVFLSTDNGESWMAVNTGFTDRHITSLAMNNMTAVAGTFSRGIFLSHNNGQTWTAVNDGLATLQIRSILLNGSRIVVGTAGGGVYVAQ